MKVQYLAFPTDRFPCFGFMICADNGKLYLPEYSNQNVVNNFAEIELGDIHPINCDNEYNIDINDERKYVYTLNDGNMPFMGTKETIGTELIKVIPHIQNAPFSKLEIAQFLNFKKQELDEILYECYLFWKKIDKKYANQWASENSFDVKAFKLKQIPEKIKNGCYIFLEWAKKIFHAHNEDKLVKKYPFIQNYDEIITTAENIHYGSFALCLVKSYPAKRNVV